MRKARHFIVLESMFVLTLTGCVVDWVCIGTQEITLGLIDVQTAKAVADALVTFTLLPTYLTSVLRHEERLDRYGRSALSDESGQVVLTDDYQVVCGGGLFPFVGPRTPVPDLVTGNTYVLLMETDAAAEILTVEFTPGNTVSGEFFEVTVVSIGEPVPSEDFD